MKLNDIHIRDPFILTDNGKYYLYGTRCRQNAGIGFDTYISEDLNEWNEPVEIFAKPDDFWGEKQYWAPEVHKYNGKYYMFASFKNDSRCRATEILVSDRPDGKFQLHNKKPVTPPDWECLDGTLYIDENNVPYMVFCHEWLQVRDGEICAVRLSGDLTESIGEPFILIRASEPDWAVRTSDDYVTDGPFFYRKTDGKLLMLWSSFSVSGYVQAMVFSDNGNINGKWTHSRKLLFVNDGGHGMLFKTFDDKLKLVLHCPNKKPNERPVIIDITENELVLD